MMETDAIVVTVPFGGAGMVWTESVELFSCKVKRRSSATQLIFLFIRMQEIIL